MAEIDIGEIIDRFKIPVGIILSICAVISGVLLFQRTSNGSGEEVRFLTQEELEKVKGLNQVDNNSGKILVDIAGQVKNPGVIEVEQGSSILQVVEAAGGFSEKADMLYVHKEMNLAELVEDRQKIYIPSIEERASTGSSSSASGSAVQTGTAALININTATAVELDTLPGVGPSTAEKIIDGRPFSIIEDLMEVSGIGESTFEKIKDKITV